MKPISEEQIQEYRDATDAAIREMTGAFMTLMTQLKNDGASAEAIASVEKLFKQSLAFGQGMNSRLSGILDAHEKSVREVDKYSNEIERLRTLYTSGITFSTVTEKQELLQIAMDVVGQALEADAGYIVLVDESGEVTDTFGRNMGPEEQQAASDMSMTVIRNTIAQSQPTQIEDTDKDVALAQKTSILHLDIKSTLCVPLMLGNQVMGAVYLDRRNEANPFREDDLAFLMSFAGQIVRGLSVSRQLEMLEDRLIADAAMTLENLREEFQCENIIGSNPVVFDMLRMASRISPTDASLLILGESGTGKELVARAIHRNSQRPQSAFVAINCGAIPDNLLESELFGYEKGAFTGAAKAKPGKIEVANEGTLFLDEIGEMDIRLQAKLLRVLQTKEIERIGSVTPRKLDIRIIAATNQDIPAMIAEKQFREDLYYRLKVIELTVPPLRERYTDIPELTEHFIEKYAPGSPITVSDEALDVLESYQWPGNIRELENVIQRCVLLVKGNEIQKDDLPQDLVSQVSPENILQTEQTLKEAEEKFRRQYILKVLRKTSSKAEAAKMLGVNRTYLYKILEELGIS